MLCHRLLSRECAVAACFRAGHLWSAKTYFAASGSLHSAGVAQARSVFTKQPGAVHTTVCERWTPALLNIPGFREYSTKSPSENPSPASPPRTVTEL
eukprot:9357548-Pyramimonas_sp.AAC.1